MKRLNFKIKLDIAKNIKTTLSTITVATIQLTPCKQINISNSRFAEFYSPKRLSIKVYLYIFRRFFTFK